MHNKLKVGYNVEITEGRFKKGVGRVCMVDKIALTIIGTQYVGVELKGYTEGHSCGNNTKFSSSSGTFIPMEWLNLTNKPLTNFVKDKIYY